MGYNTTVVIRNDGLGDIARDPHFGKNLVAAIEALAVSPRELREVPAGNHANAAQVVETHHADSTVIVAVGGNLGTVMANSYGWRHEDPELQLQLLRRWAGKLGYTLEKTA